MDRPILFICHSLGGIVFKKALLLANEMREKNKHLVHDSCRIGVVFMGTPHDRVPASVPSPGLFSRLPFTSSARPNPHRHNEATKVLQNLVSQFCGQVDRLAFVISMYSMEYPAVMNLGRVEEQLAVYTKIDEMCKFATTQNGDYKVIIAKMEKLMKGWLQNEGQAFADTASPPPSRETHSSSTGRPSTSRSSSSAPTIGSHRSLQGSRPCTPAGGTLQVSGDHVVFSQSSHPYTRSLSDHQSSKQPQSYSQPTPGRSGAQYDVLAAQASHTSVQNHSGATSFRFAATAPDTRRDGPRAISQISHVNNARPMAPNVAPRPQHPYQVRPEINFDTRTTSSSVVLDAAGRITPESHEISPNYQRPNSTQHRISREEERIQIQMQVARDYYSNGRYMQAFDFYMSVDTRLTKVLDHLTSGPTRDNSLSAITAINRKRMIVHDRLARCCLARYDKYRDLAASSPVPSLYSDSAVSDSAADHRGPIALLDLPDMQAIISQGSELNRTSQTFLQLIYGVETETATGLEYWMLRTTELALGIAQTELDKQIPAGGSLDRASYLYFMHEFGLGEAALVPIAAGEEDSGNGTHTDGWATMAGDILRYIKAVKDRKLVGGTSLVGLERWNSVWTV